MELLDDVLLGVALVCLVVRQFQWRKADGPLLRLPLILLLAGAAWLAWQMLADGVRATSLDGVVLLAELILVAAAGSLMGRCTVIGVRDGRICYRLQRWGIALWAIFLAIRIGSFFVSDALGAHLLTATPVLILSFGMNRLASSFVVRQRIARQANNADSQFSTIG